jgi:tRNA-dihydrouridine synthase B
VNNIPALLIGNLSIDPPLILAPMAGVTNHAFRVMCKRAGGCGMVSTEMFSAYAIKFRDPGTASMIDWTDEERPVAVQVFGGDPETVAVGARAMQDAGADVVDLNFGCPVPKVARSGSGAALLRNLDLAREVLIAARDAVSVPLTVKTRIGWGINEPRVFELARIAQVCGVDAMTIHGRFAVQGYSGKANWDIIAQVKRAVGIPVILNGDVTSPLDAAAAFAQTGCDGIMIGRGALGDPGVFRRIEHYLRTGEQLPPPDHAERLQAASEHAVLLRKLLGEKRAAKEMRGHLVHYIKGVSGAPKLRARLMTTGSVDEILEVLDEARRQC